MNISEHPLEANFDETKISQVFFNLLDNALKFSPPGSPIMISAGKDNEFIFVSVTDKGEGIKPEIIPHLFDPFMRGGYDIKLRHHGLGLGLSISNQLIQLHGGKIEVISTVGVGSTFTFKIPHQGMTDEP
jgi:signal transduction histidine kinase